MIAWDFEVKYFFKNSSIFGFIFVEECFLSMVAP